MRIVKVAKEQMHWPVPLRGTNLIKYRACYTRAHIALFHIKFRCNVHEPTSWSQVGFGLDDFMPQMPERRIEI